MKYPIVEFLVFMLFYGTFDTFEILVIFAQHGDRKNPE